MNVILVDDMKVHLDDLQFKIEKYCPELNIVATADSVTSALRMIHAHPPQILFLDVELGDETGFDLLSNLNKIDFKVIFVSGLEKYAHRAFKYLAIDYLLKPVREIDLINAVIRAKEELTRGIDSANIDKLNTIEDLGKPFDFFCINEKKGFTVVYFSNLIKCEADGNCTHFYQLDDEKKAVIKVTSSLNLRNYEEQLFDHDFIRVHRSHIINSKQINSYNSHEQEILLIKGLSAPLGESYKNTFLNFIKKRGRNNGS